MRRTEPFAALAPRAEMAAPRCGDRQETSMPEDNGTLLYMLVGLLVVVGAIASLTGRR